MDYEVERKSVDEFIKEEKPCAIFLVNGFQMRGQILKQDDKVIVVKARGESQDKLIYKTALSTIQPL